MCSLVTHNVGIELGDVFVFHVNHFFEFFYVHFVHVVAAIRPFACLQADHATHDLYQALQEQQKAGNWKQGQTPVQRLLGKELTLLCWAIEDSDLKVIPTAIKNWQGLKAEERWWLYTMTNASTGEANTKYWWLTAIRYALTENPVTDKYQQRSIFDQYVNDAIENYQTKKK